MQRKSPLEYLTRPARKQVERQIETHAANGVEYNIWYVSFRYFSSALTLLKSIGFTRIWGKIRKQNGMTF